MGYNTSIGPPRRMEDYLNILLRNKETVDFAAEDPSSLAYRLREAVYASKFHDRYEHFSQLTQMYEFQTLDGRVRARYLGPVDPEVIETSGDSSSESQPMTVQDAKNLTAVVGAAMDLEGKTDEIRFPNAILTKEDKGRLFGWASANDWKIIDHDDAGITLTKRDVAEEIVWTPND